MNTTGPKIVQIVARVLELDPESVGEELSRENSGSWDSFTHLLLISTIEKEMGMKFTVAQIGQIKTVGDIVNLVDSKRS